MFKNKNGYSLTVLIITIAVILIITTTAVISIKNIDKDKEISKFMNDLREVNQYTVEYFAKNNVLPVLYENGDMKSAEAELLAILSGDKALYQLDDDDIGDYYYVDIAKLGKINLADNNRGYIINEGSLNVYVKKPVEYNEQRYYTLTPHLLGEEEHQKEVEPFQVNIMGNPITWTDKADILVSIPNVKIGETEGWNFKWLKGSKTATDFREVEGVQNKVNYFTYGNVITLKENGIYTVYVENPEGYGIVRRVVVSKVDDISPTIRYASGDLIVDDAETGVYKIRCKVKENSNYPIDDESRNNFPQYYTMAEEEFSDTDETLLDKYLWGEEKIKGDTIEEYLEKYKKYYSDYMSYNTILTDPDATSGERDNAQASMKALNDSNPQFAYDNKRFSNQERNLVLYVEDMAGNATVYSAVSRDEIIDMQYVSSDIVTLAGSKIVINNNKAYTNTQEVNLHLESLYAKYVFLTETKGAAPVWEEFENSNVTYMLSSGDGEKIVYAAFKDASGKTQVVYDKIYLDTKKPTHTAPTVTIKNNKFLISATQEDTQSGISSITYGVKEGSKDFVWYSKVEDIPEVEAGKNYTIVTKVIDKAGNEQISASFSMDNSKTVGELIDGNGIKIGDYVTYSPYTATTSYKTNPANRSDLYTGYSSQTLTQATGLTWRVIKVDESTREVLITPTDAVNDGTYLSGAPGYLNHKNILDDICKTLYSNSELGVTARSMKIEDLDYTVSDSTTRYAYYPSNTPSDKLVDRVYNGVTYTAKAHDSSKYSPYSDWTFWEYDHVYTDAQKATYTETVTIDGSIYNYTYNYAKPIAVTEEDGSTTYYPILVSGKRNSLSTGTNTSAVRACIGSTYGWLASSDVHPTTSFAYFFVQVVRLSGRNDSSLAFSDGDVYSNSYGVRPVVSLSSTFKLKESDIVIDTNTDNSPVWDIVK